MPIRFVGEFRMKPVPYKTGFTWAVCPGLRRERGRNKTETGLLPAGGVSAAVRAAWKNHMKPVPYGQSAPDSAGSVGGTDLKQVCRPGGGVPAPDRSARAFPQGPAEKEDTVSVVRPQEQNAVFR